MVKSTSSEHSIPIVDFGQFLQGDDEQKAKAAREIDEAFRNVGFVYLRNHVVDRELVRECFDWSKKFFDLPFEKKMLAPHPPGHTHHRGYSAPGREKVSQHTYDAEEIAKLREVPDFKESFESGNVTDEGQPNIWPPEEVLPGFRAFMESYFAVCSKLVHSILDALSIALKVPAPGLSATHTKSIFQLRLLHYPPMKVDDLRNNNQWRINAHSDFGTLTLLFQDNVGGLEIEDPHHPGKFQSAVPLDDTVLVNMGDLMTRWSNDRWRSTIHRVGLPPAYQSANSKDENSDCEKLDSKMVPDRYSIPFFSVVDMDTEIDALPSCWSEDNPKKYESINAWDYVQMRMAALYE